MKAVRTRIQGRVQGVWFRGWTEGEAKRLALRGWVRNRSDGSVEALFIGPDPAVETMVEACRRGPPAARVDDLELFDDRDDGSTSFRQLPTI